MTDVFLERCFEPPLTRDTAVAMALESVHCFQLHRVDWLGSLLASDGRRMVCWFRGPDAESARTALRQAGADVGVLWPGSVHEAPDPPPPDPGTAQVIVARRFAEPVTFEAIQAIEDAGAWCLETRAVHFLCSYFSRDRRRMLCLYQAPDAESVRQAQHQAGMPVDAVWACHRLDPRLVFPPPG
jgi:hypothetical protein